MVASTAVQAPIPKPNSTAAFIDPETGNLTQHGLTLLTQWHIRMVGTARLIPCNATFLSNVYTLTPLSPAPSLEKYEAFDTFVFVAPSSSTGAVTMTVVPKKGTLTTLKAYKTNGSAQAGNTDLTAGLQYQATYVDTLDTAAGGFVIR